MKQLHYKLSAAMLAIVIVLGGAFYFIDRYSVRVSYEELTQRLNASLAKHLAESVPLISDGVVDSEALGKLAMQAMNINPTAEIFLLGLDGEILGHALPPDEIAVDRVDVEPIRELFSEARPLPIKSLSPRNPDAMKVFTAYPVTDAARGDEPAGYLYVVLGGSQYDAIAAQVLRSDNQRVVAASILLLVVAAFVAGALLFALLTRRLRRLTADVSQMTDEGFESAASIEAADRPGDEIGQLRNACRLMLETIQRQVESLKENDKLRRELITNISHDLRTPLASMQGYIETLIIKDKTLDAETRSKYLEIARKHAMHLSGLIQDLFELAMLDSSRVSPSFEEFPLVELIYDVVQEFELQAKEAEIRLDVAPPDDPVIVYADLSLIQRVLENLVGNALKHTPKGGSVTVSVRPASSGVGVSVSDTGRGIPPDALPYIFDRFYKRDSVETGANGSMGLGLAIAKRILELHGSEIRVVSEEQQGTRFDFDLDFSARAA
jgi:two-component system OmpR family sensor kinase